MVAKKEKPEGSLITEVLEEAFPGETSSEKASFGLVLAGVRWGRDYRFGLLPENETGTPLRALEWDWGHPISLKEYAKLNMY